MSTLRCLSTPQSIVPGIERVSINTLSLYPDAKLHNLFESRVMEFIKTNTNSQIMIYSNNVLTYFTETAIPTKKDSRPPLLLLFGNPAPDSVRNRCFFADVKGKRQPHRFWPILEKAGIISFKKKDGNDNTSRTRAIFNLDYESPFRIGLAVFFSMPSPASDPKWNGVAGLRKLFGARALSKIAENEKLRVDDIIKRFVASNHRGYVIAFQKDAYLGVKNNESPEIYKPTGKLWRIAETQCECENIKLFRLRPTRYMAAPWYLTSFKAVRELCSKA